MNFNLSTQMNTRYLPETAFQRFRFFIAHKYRTHLDTASLNADYIAVRRHL